MKNLTDSAQNRLDKYLSQVRTSLHACTSVDADEVERDIREHIETELEGFSEPVSLKDLEAVLDRLGSPSRWVPEEEIPWWRKIILRLHHGPEDWRLAYISFGLFILAFLLVSRLSFIVLLLASFCVSRAVLSMAKEPEELSGKKWLIYPPLVIVYLFILFWLFLWPLFPTVILAETQTQTLSHHSNHLGLIPNYYPGSQFYAFWITAGAAALGLWWGVLGVVGCAALTLFKTIFRPFADNLKRKWAGLLIGIGIVLIIVSLAGWIIYAFSSSSSSHQAFTLRP